MGRKFERAFGIIFQRKRTDLQRCEILVIQALSIADAGLDDSPAVFVPLFRTVEGDPLHARHFWNRTGEAHDRLTLLILVATDNDGVLVQNDKNPIPYNVVFGHARGFR